MSLPLRLLSLACTLLVLASCGSAAQEPPSQSSQTPEPPPVSSEVPVQPSPQMVRVPYDPTDSLNPFTCLTLQNLQLSNLLFDGLATLDPTYQTQLRLAQELTQEGAQWVARLRPDARFADGSAVTAQDVAYSVQLALGDSRFGAALAGVAQVQTPDDATLVFVLTQPDQFFDRALTFPVVKQGTGEQPVPVGSGRYTLDPGGGSLTANPQAYPPIRNLRRVELVDAGSLEDQGQGVADGTIDLMYSDLRSDLNLGLGSGHRQVPLSNLLFVGVNPRGPLADPRMREALSGLLPREELGRKTQLSFASTAYSPIRPAYGGSAVTGAGPGADRVAAILDGLGYDTLDEEGCRTAGGARLTLTLLVNRENRSRVAAAQLIAQAAKGEGVLVTVERLSYEEYLARIAARDYDLYLGELRIPYNLDLEALLAPGALGPGVEAAPQLLELYHRVKAGEAPMAQLDALIRRETPVMPILYRRGILCFSRDFSANIVATERDIFYNIGDW